MPVFENLDRRYIGKERADEIPGILDQVLASGVLEGAELPEHLPRFSGRRDAEERRVQVAPVRQLGESLRSVPEA